METSKILAKSSRAAMKWRSGNFPVSWKLSPFGVKVSAVHMKSLVSRTRGRVGKREVFGMNVDPSQFSDSYPLFGEEIRQKIKRVLLHLQ